MKKILAALLALALILSFAACAKDNDDTSSTADVVSTDDTSSTADVVSTEDIADSTEKSFVRGTVSGKTYENEFLGLGVEVGDGWIFYSDEEIATLYGIVEDTYLEDFEEYLKTATIVYDMQVVDPLTGNNIGVTFEKLTAEGEAATVNMEVFATSLIPTIINSLELMGCTDISSEPKTFEIGGQTFYGSKVSSLISGVELHQMSIAVKCDGYVAFISITSVGSDTTQSIVDSFYVLK